MSITATRRCDVCLIRGPVRHSGARWMCRWCFEQIVGRPFDGPKEAT